MNYISSVGGSYSSTSASRLGGPAKQLEKNLTNYLDSKGFSAEQQFEIKADLEEAIQSSMSGGRPNPSKMQESIKGVLEKHEIDSKELMSKMPSMPSGGMPGQGSAWSSTEQDYMKTLLDFLDERARASKRASQESSDVATSDDSSSSSDGSAALRTPKTSETGSFDVQA